MERLTVTDLNKACYDPWELCGMDSYCTKGCHEQGGCTKGCEVLKMYKKLAGYEDFEEQGLLLRLPCKVGDTVYRIRYNRAKNKIWGAHITTEIFSLKFYAENSTLFGKTIFPTRFEAEEALKGMKRKV